MKHEREQRSDNALVWLLGYMREHTETVRQQQGIELLTAEQCGAIWSRIAGATGVVVLEEMREETEKRCIEMKTAHLAKLHATIAEHGEYHEKVGTMLYDHGILLQHLEPVMHF